MTNMQLKRTIDTSIGGLWGSEPTDEEVGIAVVRVADFDYPSLTVSIAPTSRVIEGHLAGPRTLHEGDLLIEKSGGGDQQNVGRVVQWTGGAEATFSNFINLLRPARGFNPRWLAYLHRHLYLTGAQASCTKQTTGIQNLDLRAYLAIQVDVPDVDEQQKVADLLDRECERIGRLSSELTNYTRRLAGPALEEFRHLTQWIDHGRVGYRFNVQLGKMLDEKRVDPSDVSPYLRNANVHWDRLELSDVKSMTFSSGDRRKFELRPGDVLVCEGGEPGRAAVWDGEIAGCYYQKALHRLRAYGEDSPRFLFWCLRDLSTRGAFGSDGPGRYTHLTAEQLRAVRIPLPAPSEQHRIAEVVDTRATNATRVSEEVEGLQLGLHEYRDSLITEAVTGKLDVDRLSGQQLDESVHAASEASRPEVLPA